MTNEGSKCDKRNGLKLFLALAVASGAWSALAAEPSDSLSEKTNQQGRTGDASLEILEDPPQSRVLSSGDLGDDYEDNDVDKRSNRFNGPDAQSRSNRFNSDVSRPEAGNGGR